MMNEDDTGKMKAKEDAREYEISAMLTASQELASYDEEINLIIVTSGSPGDSDMSHHGLQETQMGSRQAR
jgi:hypothetical protein